MSDELTNFHANSAPDIRAKYCVAELNHSREPLEDCRLEKVTNDKTSVGSGV